MAQNDLHSGLVGRPLGMMKGAAIAVALGSVATLANASLVGTFEVGSGSSTSHLQFDFANGNSYLYTVHWEGLDGTTTGRDLFDIVATAQPSFFVSEIVTFSFGDALYGQTIGGDTNAGFGTPPDYLDYWHYWLRESDADAWESAFVGFGDRVVSNGSWDGWVFGSDGGPAAVPAPGVLAALIAVTGIGRGPLSRSRRRA